MARDGREQPRVHLMFSDRQLHRGPAVSGIEARGQESTVGLRQREQRHERTLARAAVISQVQVVTRHEMAIERVAVRERRELAHEVTGEERQQVLPWLEADRREQLGRVQAAVEMRIERRQSSRIGELKEKLLTQARALRERLGHELGKVREWVLEHFPDPLQQLKAHSTKVVQSVVDHARSWGRGPSVEELQRQGREEWLAMRAAQASTPTPSKADLELFKEHKVDLTPAPARTWPLGQAPESLFVKRAQKPAAKPPRSAAEQERERLASMSSQELWNLYYDRNPTSVGRLVEQDLRVGGARLVIEGHQRTADQALQSANRAKHESLRWREAHGMQAKLHDVGLKPAAYLVERDAAWVEEKRVRAAALEAVTPAMARYTQAHSEATQRITHETAPARAHAAEFKQLAREAREAGEREKLVQEFEMLAHARARGRRGFEDHSPDRQATSPKLKQMIDTYNHAPLEVKKEFRLQLSTRPDRAQWLEQHLKQRRELGLDGPDHGHSL